MSKAPKYRKYMKVIADNARRKREERGMTKEDMAVVAQKHGLQWSQNTVTAFEQGRRQLSPGEWWYLPRVLDTTWEELALPADRGPVDVEGVLHNREELRALVTGKTVKRLAHEDALAGARLVADTDPALAAIAKKYRLHTALVPRLAVESHGSAELKAARKLGVDPFEIVAAAHSLWECSLTEWRDLGLEDLQPGQDLRALRGHVTRRLLGELADRIAGRRRAKAKR